MNKKPDEAKEKDPDHDRGDTREAVDELTKRNVETIAKMERASHTHRTIGETIADGFANAIGSWTFIITQSILLTLWMILNALAWIRHWDPYPFILLNLALSFQAAFAGPIIMMSQNRQQRLAERRNHLDLQINLLAEQESTETLRLLRQICQRLDIPIADGAEEDALEQPTRLDRVVEQIEKSVDRVPKTPEKS